MKLPRKQLQVYLSAGERKRLAVERIGTVHLEYKMYLEKAEKDWARQNAEQDAAVADGLRELGLEPSTRHFHVFEDGTIKEIVKGAYVDVEETQ